MLILMAGLPGTGKTHVATKLAAELSAAILSKDTVRHTLFSPELVEYSTQQDDFVIGILLRTVEYIWKRDRRQALILDGRTFSQASQRHHVIEFAESQRQPWRIIECVCDEQTAKQRLSQSDPQHPAGNRTPALYDEVKARWQPIEEPKIIVRTDSQIDITHIIQEL